MAYQIYLENFDQQDWRDCTAQGDVAEACQYLVRKYLDQFETIPLANVRDHLREYGAWDDLDEVDADTLYQRLAFANAPTMLELGLVWVD